MLLKKGIEITQYPRIARKTKIGNTAVPQTGHEGLSPDFSRKEAPENAKRKMDWDSPFFAGFCERLIQMAFHLRPLCHLWFSSTDSSDFNHGFHGLHRLKTENGAPHLLS
jgi:hypothetical protein